MPSANLSIVDEVEAAINLGSAEKSLDAVRRVTDLFLSSAGSFDKEQIELFDRVLERLIKTIEIRALADVSARMALAEMSMQLAPIAQAPPTVIRRTSGRGGEGASTKPPLEARQALGRSGANRGNKKRVPLAGHFWPMVVEGSYYRRAVGAPLSER